MKRDPDHEKLALQASPDLAKRREIGFAKFPPGQVAEAADELKALERLEVTPAFETRQVAVAYSLIDYTLRELEEHLEDRGYHLDNTLMAKVVRALIHYVEDTQLHNLGVPERLIKKSHEAYVRAWEQHPHGDRDETPPEWREYQ